MFKLQRQSRQVARSGDRSDFRFSNFQAIQVPKGWDKLFVSVIFVESGKTIAKSSKAPVRNGNCQWSETLSESILPSQNDSQEALEDCLLKFVVAMGSARSGILGEAIVNLADYMSSKSSVPVFLPLKKCNHGTILQVKIQCLNPSTKFRAQESKNSSSHLEDQIADHAEVECKSYGSEDSFTRNSESPSSKDLGSVSHQEEVQSKHTSLSETGSHHSSDSVDGSTGREIFFPCNDLNGDKYSPIRRQESSSSETTPPHNKYIAEKPSQSTHPLSNPRFTGSGSDSHLQMSLKRSSQFKASSALANSGSSKTFLEAADETIEELRAESKLWERNARKLMLDMDILKKDFSNQMIKHADKDMELSAAYTERDGLKKEVEQLKLVLEETLLKQRDAEDSTFQLESGVHIQKELEREIKFQHEYSSDLAMQLKRTQESNIELVTVLQELEEIIEKQKAEIENLSTQKFTPTDNSSPDNQALLDIQMEYELKVSAKEEEIASLKAKLAETLVDKKSNDLDIAYRSDTDLIGEIVALKEKLQDLENDCSELATENLELLLKLKDYKNCTSCYSSRELPEKSYSISESVVTELKSKIQLLEEELQNTTVKKNQLTVSDYPDLVEQLKMAFYLVKKPWYNISSLTNDEIDSDTVDEADGNNTDEASPQGGEHSILNFVNKLNKLLECRIIRCEEVLKHCEVEIKERDDDLAEAQKIVEDYVSKEKKLAIYIEELENSNSDLHSNILVIDNQLKEKLYEINKLAENLTLKENELGSLRDCTSKLEVWISILENEKNQLKEKLEIVQKENNSHVSTKQILEKECSELEKVKEELEFHLNEIEEGNLRLSKTVSSLEAQLRDLTDENESNILEIENSRSVSMSLIDEIKNLKLQIESEKTDSEEKLQDIQNKILDIQNEFENLKLSNKILEASVESLTEECNTLQMENELMREGKSELLAHCTDLETELTESQQTSSDYSKRVEALEENLSSVLEDFSVKEKRLGSEMDALLQENRNLSEKFVLAENLSNKLLAEKLTEIENLQKEIEKLKYQISLVDDSETEQELSSLRATKADLELALNDLQSRVKMTENELDTLRTECEAKVNGLMVELSTSRKKHEMLMADHEKVKKLLGCNRSSEGKLQTKLNDIELKLTVSEYERQKLSEETANLKVKLQKSTHFEDEIIALKAQIDAFKSEKLKLEAFLQSASENCENLKIEKTVLVQKITCFQTAMSEFEECKREKVSLEEKLHQLKSDLSTGKALQTEHANLKHEVSQIKSENAKLLSMMQKLEEEKNELVKHVSKSTSIKGDKFDREVDHTEKVQLLENELAQALEANNKYQNQLQRLLSEGRNNAGTTPSETETTPKDKFERTKSSLEAELRDIRERYFQMSLKYAEVEADREDLVMKLKATKSGNRWFS